MTFLVSFGLSLLPFTPLPGRPRLCRSASSMAGPHPCMWCIMSAFPQKKEVPPATLCCRLPGAPGDWPCLAAEAADMDKVCSGEQPSLPSLCTPIFCLSHLGDRQWWVQVLLHQLSSKLFALPGQEGSMVKAGAGYTLSLSWGKSLFITSLLLPRVAEMRKATICFIYLQLCAQFWAGHQGFSTASQQRRGEAW